MVGGIMLHSCSYNNSEELYPSSTLCDTTSMSYATDIVPILQHNGCINCHNTTNPSGNIELEKYTDVSTHVSNGKLMGSIKHAKGYAAMPAGRTEPIEKCAIRQLEAWIAAGALNN